jgi:hypothetical protein
MEFRSEAKHLQRLAGAGIEAFVAILWVEVFRLFRYDAFGVAFGCE